MTPPTGEPRAATEPRDTLDGPDPGDHEDEIGGPDENDHGILGDPDQEAEEDEVLGGPDENESDILGPDPNEREDILRGPA
jgi:hypothetical protein